VIVAINNVATKSVAQLQEQIGRYRPGDKIEVTLIRDNKTKKLVVELKNRAGNTGVVKAVDLSHLGAKFSAVSDQFKYKFRIKNGLQISQLDKNGKFAKSGLKEGFVILKINNITIVNQEDIERAYNEALNNEANEKVLFITGIYNNGQVAYYAVNLE
jgi:S1-C subfamily serine protease